MKLLITLSIVCITYSAAFSQNINVGGDGTIVTGFDLTGPTHGDFSAINEIPDYIN